jgi:hypothetical protein
VETRLVGEWSERLLEEIGHDEDDIVNFDDDTMLASAYLRS